MSIRNLGRMFAPRSVALIGASDRPQSVGAVVSRNLLRGGFAGPIMPVNPRHAAIESVLCYPDIDHLPVVPDLAVIATPAVGVPALVDALGARGCRAAIVLSADFGRGAANGADLRQALLDAAKPHLLRVIGPNCLGVAVPGIGLNATFSHIPPLTGDVACLTQSGAIATTLIDWATSRGIGFSHMVSLGDMADVDVGDMLDYLAHDGQVRAILLYVEGVTEARKFMSAARAAARTKPVIILKAGRYLASATAATSHTGALAGADAVYDAAFRRAGMLRVGSLDEMFSALETLSHARRIPGDRLTILTNGGGVGVLATDALIGVGGTLAQLSAATLAALDGILPATWSRGNPVDIIGDADGARYAAALEIVLADPETDACLVLNCPQAVTTTLESAEAVIATLRKLDVRAQSKVMVNWLGEGAARAARSRFAEAGLPSYETPERAVTGFMHLREFRRNQQLLIRVPPATPVGFAPDLGAARAIVATAGAAGQEWLDEADSKALLAAYGIPVATVRRVAQADQVADAAREIDRPVAVKIISPDITHKSDMGGVALDLATPEAAGIAAHAMLARIRAAKPDARIEGFAVQEMVTRPDAIELIIGLVSDPIFGPVLLFGRGGTAVEVIGDKALALAPLDMMLARDLIASTRVSRRLAGFRTVPPADLDAIALSLVKLSQMTADLPELVELDINPLLADPHGVMALDARIRLGRRAPFAILPYPSALERRIALKDGTQILVRPVKPEDAPAFERNFQRMRPEDIQHRFFAAMKALPVQLLARLTQIDYDREMAFVALPPLETGQFDDGYGVVRIAADPDNERAEFAVIVRSDWQGRGLGRALMDLILDYARDRGLAEVWGTILHENTGMIDLVRRLGFTVRADPEDPTLVTATFAIRLG
ncbi:MAG TPA: bifunctional acetate--CoA ligase family protein/GNAT family N-acetyltransferase [Aliidongia sp.]|uniref:bifunctional acetate--CoA ligase family protein/GNAT family N-acetyltransferase n=1 Tax=Aliidongia sp. TaxID=1914230 RepID=UPI002DDCC33D|nr:bifunctional acetate--CoA ligase family protein/GNAT family N-acetyltransferase [Aliidongia sp.]HEV2674860.1 bifunctional acetate--CoA ligase family protein/GNAT family N-acetyltransferase [Aliidongia sp.]